ncbi:pimeloyl-ACP methyl ester carboxylesterase [Flavobacteriaceae bacterium MAR_2009_75]|nr:pimeloyl-ACP methyl ester carboxylesterase [Flavobacteriaceae bacterium MAR_2009_75]
MNIVLHKVFNTLAENKTDDETVVVFLHGNSANSLIWRNQFKCELLQNFRMMALDLPGHGASPKLEEYSLTQLVDILVDSCQNFPKMVLVGHSLGGHLAIEALPKLPNCIGLLIFGTPPVKSPLNLHEAFLADERISLLFKGQLNATERVSFVSGICSDTSPARSKLIASLSNTDPKFREGIGVSAANGEFSDEVEILRNARLPIAVMHGANDALVNADYIEKLEIPYLWKQKVHYIEGSTHSPHVENPSYFNQLLFQFLEDI